jgi:hypothetical protein
MFVPMNIPQYNRDGSLTVLFQMNTKRNSLSIPLEKCLDGSGHCLKNPDEIMFSTVDRTQVHTFKLVIAVSLRTLNSLRRLIQFQWPGYNTVEYPIDIGTNEAPITRAQLARQIAYHFFGFFKVCIILPPNISRCLISLLISCAILVISLRHLTSNGKSEVKADIRFIRCTSQHSGILKALPGVPPSESSDMPSAGLST